MLSSTTTKIIEDTIDLICVVEGDEFLEKLVSPDELEGAITHIKRLAEITDKQMDEFVEYLEAKAF